MGRVASEEGKDDEMEVEIDGGGIDPEVSLYHYPGDLQHNTSAIPYLAPSSSRIKSHGNNTRPEYFISTITRCRDDQASRLRFGFNKSLDNNSISVVLVSLQAYRHSSSLSRRTLL